MTGWRIVRGGVLKTMGTFAATAVLAFFASQRFDSGSAEGELSDSSKGKLKPGIDAPGRDGIVDFEAMLKRYENGRASSSQRIARLEAIARELPLADIPKLVDGTSDWPAQEREAFLGSLFTRWAESDPAAALAYSAQIDIPHLRAKVAERAIQVWANREPRAALEWLKAQPEGDHRLRQLKSFIQTLEQSEPALAFEACRLLPYTRIGDEFREQVLVRLAAREPKAAIAALASLPSNSQLRSLQFRQKVAGLWIQKDVQEAFLWLRTAPGGERVLLEGVLLRALGEKNPQMALQWLEALTPAAADFRLGDVVAGWAARDPIAARAYVNTLPPGTARNTAMAYLVDEVGLKKNDVAAVIAINREWNPDSNKEMEKYLMAMLKEQSTDPRKIMEALRQLPQSSLNQELLQSFTAQWAAKQPDEAAEYLKANGLLAEHAGAAAEIVETLTRKDPEEAVAWASGLPPGAAREAALSKALQHLAGFDQSRAAQLMMQLAPEGRATVAGTIAAHWTERDPAGAARWAGELADPAVRERASEGIAGAWARLDPQACAEWLKNIPAGSLRDTVVEAYARAVMQADPESAVQWAGSVQDTNQRRRLIEYLAAFWWERDRPAATAWIKQTPLLSPTAKQWVLTENLSR